jgi:ATP-dependent DNA ligase
MLGDETTSITFRGPAPTSHMTLAPPPASRGFSLRPASYISLVPRIRFIPIASPKLRPAPPTGPDWLHEVKFDGFRLQIHKVGDEVRLFSRNGRAFTDSYPSIVAAMLRLGAKSAVIDGELVSCDPEDKPD